MRYSFEIKGAAEEEEELQVNLKTLLETRAGSQPVDRDFGISWEFMKEIPEVAESILAAELTEKVEKYEPRVEIEDMEISAGEDGEYRVHIKFIGKEDT